MHSWTSILRPVSLGLVVLGLAGSVHAGEPGDGSNSPACCQLTTSMINDVLRGKDVSGDEKFFSADGAPPNIHFLVDTSGSMRELPQLKNGSHYNFFADTVNGCQNPDLEAFSVSKGWNPTTVYPIPDPGTGLGSDNGFNNLFQDSKFYAYMNWADLSDPSPDWDTKEEACESQVGSTIDPAQYALCLSCLNTKGYFKVDGAEGNDEYPFNPQFILWGRFLNFNPPKYVTARSVLKQVIKSVQRVRAGLSHFSSSNPNTVKDKGQNPSCDQIVKDASSFDSNRASYISAINGFNFTTRTPLARSLLNVGYYFTSEDSVYHDDFGFGDDYSYPSSFRTGSLTSQGRTVCWGCQVSSVIIITDGEPTNDDLNPLVVDGLRAKNGGPVYCADTDADRCTDGDLPDFGYDQSDLNDDNPNYYLDDIAKLLNEQDLQKHTPPVIGDLNTAGKQTVSTYTVGFGVNSNLLRHTAEVGGGLYYTADDATSLKNAILEIIKNVQTRATSFSSPAASTLQVRSASATLLPRFKPARNKTAPWQGMLYRFEMGPERLLGCNPLDTTAGGDLNQDGDCNDTLMIDAAGDAIIENDDGDFVKLLSPLSPAQPFWEAGKVLKPSSAATTRWQTRQIWTIVDNNNDGKVDFRDTPIAFTEANAATLRPYLGISQNPSGCSDLAAKIGVGSLTPDDCARLVIRWYRGADALNTDPAKRGNDRPFLLHDIFHSSPSPVDPPMPRNFCTFSNQCIQTLFAGATPQQSDYVIGARTNVPAYDMYEYSAGDRDKIVLVGSNGGMLHAFQNGITNGATDSFTGQRKYDAGTGEELWAFIPPDLLPKLRTDIAKHNYFVDGSAMVRDVWIDGADGQPADGQKQWEEYRTVAVVGTGRGGVHRFALDLTRLLGTAPGVASTRVPDHQGDFLWMWPQPCDALALQVGESFSNFAPMAPPIGPVALTPAADDALRTLYGSTGSPVSPYTINGTSARERYIVMLNGGFDQSLTRGRGMAVVDIRSGHTIWSYFHGDGKSRSQYLRYPIGAGITPLDIGTADGSIRGDGLFDTATVGDYGGQLWTVRMWYPGTWDSAKQQVDNWFAARSFRVKNLAGLSTDAEAVRPPFSYMTLNTIQPGTNFLRTFVGTGDRENLLDQGSVCRLGNERACAAQGCGVSQTLTVERGGSTALTATAKYDNYHYTSSSVATGAPGAACTSAKVKLTWDNTSANGCGNGNDGTIEYTCGGTTTTWACNETQNTWAALNYALTPSPYANRYYGIYTYGGTDPKRKFNTDAEANVYDGNLYTDTDLTNVGQFAASGTTAGDVDTAGQQTAPTTGKGWYIGYGVANERTGGTGTLVNGCVLWNSFEPSGATGAVCATTGTNVARLYQAGYATGLANCATSFFDTKNDNDPTNDKWKRFIQTTVVAAPAEPAIQYSVGAGQTVIGIGVPDVGSGANGGGGTWREVKRRFDGVMSLYQLEVDRRAHDCRHGGVNCN